MTNLYTVEDHQIIAHDLDEVRRNVNMANGCPMPSGVRPRYEIQERTEYRIMQAGEDGYGDNQYGRAEDDQQAQAILESALEDDPSRRAWIDEATVFVVGYNSFGVFHRFAKFDAEAEAEDRLAACIDELIEQDESTAWYWTQELAQEALDQED